MIKFLMAVAVAAIAATAQGEYRYDTTRTVALQVTQKINDLQSRTWVDTTRYWYGFTGGKAVRIRGHWRYYREPYFTVIMLGEVADD